MLRLRKLYTIEELEDLLHKHRNKYFYKFSFCKNIDAKSLVKEEIKSIHSLSKIGLLYGIYRSDNLIGFLLMYPSFWDSKILGINVGKLKFFLTTHVSSDFLDIFLKKILEDMRLINIKVLFFRIPVFQYFLLNYLCPKLLLTDILVTLCISSRDIAKYIENNTGTHALKFEHAEPKDLPILISLTTNAFLQSHYHNDPFIPYELAEKIFYEWIKNSVYGYADNIIIAKYKNNILGYLTCKINKIGEKRYGIIDLVAVDKRFRGRGIGTALVKRALKWFLPTVEYVFVGTQATNIPAIRMYEKVGFRTVSIEATFHLWYDNKLKRS